MWSEECGVWNGFHTPPSSKNQRKFAIFFDFYSLIRTFAHDFIMSSRSGKAIYSLNHTNMDDYPAENNENFTQG